MYERVKAPFKSLCFFFHREKEALLAYLKSVERALEQSIDQVRLSQGTVGLYELSLPQLMTPDERLALDGQSVGPEMLAIQVRQFSFPEPAMFLICAKEKVQANLYFCDWLIV